MFAASTRLSSLDLTKDSSWDQNRVSFAMATLCVFAAPWHNRDIRWLGKNLSLNSIGDNGFVVA